MVNKNENLIFAAFQVVAPRFKSFNHSPDFLIVSLVSNLNRDFFLEKRAIGCH